MEPKKQPLIAVLAVQGAFIEHEKMLRKLGAKTVELRSKEDLNMQPDGLVLPGGESTVQSKLLRENGMLEPIKAWISAGVPVLATCAGLILLAQHVEETAPKADATAASTARHFAPCFATMPITVRRNAYGRQLGSFITEADIKGIGTMRLNFIRAPYIESVDNSVDVLAHVQGNIVAAKYKNQIALAFHPEVGTDTRIHEKFLQLCHRH